MKPSYYQRVRTSVLAMIPGDAQRFLSIGCGEGATEEVLVQRGARVTGIEIQAEPAQAAASRGIRVIHAPAEDGLDRLDGETYDCLVFPDVLEHLRDPEAVLARACESLEPGGAAVISVPNFRHASVLWQLLVKGEIRYETAGILDSTHIRMTTRKMAERWIRAQGMTVESVVYHTHRRSEKWIRTLSLGLLREFVCRQVLIRARKSHG